MSVWSAPGGFGMVGMLREPDAARTRACRRGPHEPPPRRGKPRAGAAQLRRPRAQGAARGTPAPLCRCWTGARGRAGAQARLRAGRARGGGGGGVGTELPRLSAPVTAWAAERRLGGRPGGGRIGGLAEAPAEELSAASAPEPCCCCCCRLPPGPHAQSGTGHAAPARRGPHAHGRAGARPASGCGPARHLLQRRACRGHLSPRAVWKRSVSCIERWKPSASAARWCIVPSCSTRRRRPRSAGGARRKAKSARRKAQGARRKAQGARRKAQGARRKAQGARRKAQGADPRL